MRQAGLRAQPRRRFRVTTQSQHAWPIAPNHLAQDFTATAVNQKWVADITYVPTGQGWLYLATVEDLFSRRIVGWSMGTTLTDHLTCQALRMALAVRPKASSTIPTAAVSMPAPTTPPSCTRPRRCPA